jgi:hypothetical protein
VSERTFAEAVEAVRLGRLPCRKCGRQHVQHEIDEPTRPGLKPALSWGDQFDGHAYYKMDWRSFFGEVFAAPQQPMSEESGES